MHGSVNTLKFVSCFQFQVMPAFDDYITLHNLSMPLTYIATLYHIHGCGNHSIKNPKHNIHNSITDNIINNIITYSDLFMIDTRIM